MLTVWWWYVENKNYHKLLHLKHATLILLWMLKCNCFWHRWSFRTVFQLRHKFIITCSDTRLKPQIFRYRWHFDQVIYVNDKMNLWDYFVTMLRLQNLKKNIQSHQTKKLNSSSLLSLFPWIYANRRKYTRQSHLIDQIWANL